MARPAPYTPADFRLRLDRDASDLGDASRPTRGGSPWPFAHRPLLDRSAPVPQDAPPAATPVTRPATAPLSPLQWEQVVARTSTIDTGTIDTGTIDTGTIDPGRIDTSDAAVLREVAPAVPQWKPADPLALVPDAPEGRADVAVVVPPIVPAEPEPAPLPTATSVLPTLAASPALPSLAAPPRPTVPTGPAAPAAPGRPQPVRAMPVVAAPVPAGPHRRSLLPRLVSLLLVVTLLGGGVLAVTRYLMAVPAWDADVRPMADEVATIRGLAFRSPVGVEELPIGRYVNALTDSVLPTAAAERAMVLAEWRAFGLLDDTLGLATAGRRAMVDMPAFYDHERGVVVVADGLGPTLKSFAMERALAWALLDQHQDWSASMRGAGPGDAQSIRAAVDADALAIARSAVGTPAEHQRLLAELDDWASTVLGAGEAGVSWLSATLGRPGAPEAERVRMLPNEQRPAPPAPASASTARGAMFWYHVLAVHLDPMTAWRASTAVVTDTTVTVAEGAGGTACTTALVTAVDAAGAGTLLAAFGSWVAAAPSAVDASASSAGELDVRVRACDPGARSVRGAGDGVVPFGAASAEAYAVTLAEREAGQLARPVRDCIAGRARAAIGSIGVGDLAPVMPSLDGWAPPSLAAFDVGAAAATCQAG